MRVSFSVNCGFSKNHFNNFTSNQIEKRTEQEKDQKTNSRIIKNSAYAATALAILGTGIYIYNSIKKPSQNHAIQNTITKDILPSLPDTPLAKSLPDFLKKALSTDDNFEKLTKFMTHPQETEILGSGANSTVYNLPFLDEYVLKVLNPDKHIEPNKIPLGIFPDNINLGQPVWINPENNRFILLKKVTGRPNSIYNWSKTIYNQETGRPQNIEPEQAINYFFNITKISQMSQKAFDDLANQVKILDTTPKYNGDPHIGFKTDCINPNNLLIDFDKEEFHFIDYFAKDNSKYQNSYMDMVAVISDFTLMPEFFDLLPPNEQKQLLSSLKEIDKKCFKAAEKVGLTTDKDTFLTYIDKTNKYFPIQSVKKHHEEGEYKREYSYTARKLLEILKNNE